MAMITRARPLLAFALTLAALTLTLSAHGFAEGQGEKVLVFSKTAAFRHRSIEDGVAAIGRLGNQHGFVVDATEDAEASGGGSS